ncbi:MAG: hemerythrin domain-containing protein [Cyclobacteriaceae bacterium]|jgi:regulator of cell morphogenesis and NO signaling|nr:hemerythrin domain-containing protein [Cyclobacteriaceae bacterium]MDH4298300.1 hemerythrin domain-containing protein [Cyclobacteriaceae bacterium]MDH5249180.1 hemerythrin domain-containing protein [Cyclobacteriaceae bacterium]
MSKQTNTLPPIEETSQILQRYDVSQAHTMAYTYEELRNIGIQPEFILALLGVFEDQNSFSAVEFNHFPLPVIVDYLHKTHEYYINKKLLEIEQSIHLLVDAYPSTHPLLLLLHNFYVDYKSHLRKHIEMEERNLFPYILQLAEAADRNEKIGTATAISIQQFINEHHDTEKDLEEVRKTILHYSPPTGNQTLYRILLSQLQVFEKDLAVHALMEDDVLLPRALELEKQLLDA